MSSQADVAVFEVVSSPPPATCIMPYFGNNHKSDGKENASPPGVKALGKCGPTNVEDATGGRATDSKDDDDIDLFGTEEEEESKAKRPREQRLHSLSQRKPKPRLPSSYM